MREAALDTQHRILMAVVVLSASASVIDFLGLQSALAFISVIAGTFDLVFDLSNRARDHRDSRLGRAALLAELGNIDDTQLVEFEAKAQLARLSAVPTHRAVRALSYNEALESLTGSREGAIRINWIERLFAHIHKFRGATKWEFRVPEN